MKRLIDPAHVHSIRRDLTGIALFVGAILIVFLLDRFFALEAFGLVPRQLSGLTGIVAMPFLHKDWTHLVGNLIPLVITLALLSRTQANTPAIVILITIFSGVLLWLMGRTALHIGASALVFGLLAFLVVIALQEKKPLSVVIALGLAIVYGGSFIRGILPFQPGISWDGHLFGAAGGVIVALLVAQDNRLQNRSKTRRQ